MPAVTVDDIRAAAEVLRGAVVATPTVPATALSQRLGCTAMLKLETLQHTGSFKDRGALNKLAALPQEARERGVIAISAGNHAQGVAYHAARLGIPATIVMPRLTPFRKVAKTEALGANVVLTGDTLEDALPTVDTLIAERGLTMIHPFDDPAIIAGQGTIGLEMLAAVPELTDLIVPIGGGGLISGVAIAARALNPHIRITGVEAAAYPSMSDAIAGRPNRCGGATVAEGIAVKHPGDLTRPIVEALVDDIVIVDEADLERAINTLLTAQNLLAEGAGASGLAALTRYRDRFEGRIVGLVICGANIDPAVLSSILLRGLVRDGQLIRLRVEIVDAPGALSRVTGAIGAAGGNIVEVTHQRLHFRLPVKRTDVDLLVETRDRRHVQRILDSLVSAGFTAHVLPADDS